ncbi:deoxyhypusine hydroxylase isoform X2 [Monodon monoceros]|uniref:deoxyhypusine hydroxylase isoform X2 n=1 Tax=Monodon monoceros TaxID=40151 RepID=UPI0010F57FB3|nr:deoxyhypusine hydroxylase isoform X2 [Monodon monoceros]
MVTEQEVEGLGQMLVDPQKPLQARFRALFTLRGLGGPAAISWISRAFSDDSALLKHELAYCLGQMQDSRAIPVLVDVLRDTRQEPMVRHEAGEALGAIGDPEVLEILKQYSTDPVIEVTQPLPHPPPCFAPRNRPQTLCLVARVTTRPRDAERGPLPHSRWQRRASWPSGGWSGCSSTAGSRWLRGPTSPWIRPHPPRSAMWGGCGWRCWMRPGRSSTDTEPCLPCVMLAGRRLPWRWLRACTAAVPSSATRSATSWASCSTRRPCPSWRRPWRDPLRTPWCGTSARRP